MPSSKASTALALAFLLSVSPNTKGFIIPPKRPKSRRTEEQRREELKNFVPYTYKEGDPPPERPISRRNGVEKRRLVGDSDSSC
jgi:hypothetical protein